MWLSGEHSGTGLTMVIVAFSSQKDSVVPFFDSMVLPYWIHWAGSWLSESLSLPFRVMVFEGQNTHNSSSLYYTLNRIQKENLREEPLARGAEENLMQVESMLEKAPRFFRKMLFLWF